MDIGEKIKKNLYEYKRIIAISNKPTTEEFLNIAKVCGIGIIIVGLMGFLIQVLGTLLLS